MTESLLRSPRFISEVTSFLSPIVSEARFESHLDADKIALCDGSAGIALYKLSIFQKYILCSSEDLKATESDLKNQMRELEEEKQLAVEDLMETQAILQSEVEELDAKRNDLLKLIKKAEEL